MGCLLGPPKGMGPGLRPAAMLGGGWTWRTTSLPSKRRRRLSSAHRSDFMLSSLPSTATTTLARFPVAMDRSRARTLAALASVMGHESRRALAWRRAAPFEIAVRFTDFVANNNCPSLQLSCGTWCAVAVHRRRIVSLL
jgi:hypothetical protein